MSKELIGAVLMGVPTLIACFAISSAIASKTNQIECELFVLLALVLCFLLGRAIAGQSFISLLLG